MDLQAYSLRIKFGERDFTSCMRGPAVEHRSLDGVLSLSCARPVMGDHLCG